MKQFISDYKYTIGACALTLALGLGNWLLAAVPTQTSVGNDIIVAGKVGVGTTSPVGKLTVDGDDIYVINAEADTGSLRLGAAWGYPGIYGESATKPLVLGSATGNIYMNGNVGIGATIPGAQLHIGDIYSAGGKNLMVGDDTYLTDIDTNNMLGIYGNQNPDRAGIRLGSDGSYIFGDGGNVGIGTIIPSEKLEVNGNIKAVGFLYSSSDERLKKDINKIDNALEKILELEGVSFRWKDNDERLNVGLIAQDVEKVFPEVILTSEIDGLKSIGYGNLVAPVIEAIKDLADKIDVLFEKYFDQQKQIDLLEERIENLENQIK